jgi:hypothetical protein
MNILIHYFDKKNNINIHGKSTNARKHKSMFCIFETNEKLFFYLFFLLEMH